MFEPDLSFASAAEGALGVQVDAALAGSEVAAGFRDGRARHESDDGQAGGASPSRIDRGRALADLEVAGLSDDELVELVATWQRQTSWCAAQQAVVVAELVARQGGLSRAAEGVVHELSAALTTSRADAELLVGRAVALGAMPAVADALTDGRIDTRRADVLTMGEDVPLVLRERVAAELVGTSAAPGDGCGLTARALRDRLRRAAIDADPAGAAGRAERARRGRRVLFEPTNDSMAWLSALLPADDAARAWGVLDAAATAVVRTPGETRSTDEVRADVLVDLLVGSVPIGSVPIGTSAAPALGSGEQDPAVRGLPHAVARGRHTGGVQVGVTVSASTLLGLDECPGDLNGYGPIPASMARALAAGPDATWRRIVTDPVTGVLTDVSRTAYRPGEVLGDLVRERDGTCTFPGCRVPARRCDLDHIDPFDADVGVGGQTRADNLHPVCRGHHNAKTHGGWSTARCPDGTVVWTSPIGREHPVALRPADPRHVPIRTLAPGRRRRSGRTTDEAAPHAAGPDDGLPPF
jgi:hypothetical protein